MLSPLPTKMSIMVTNAEWIRDRCLCVVCVVLEQNIRASDSNPWRGPTWSPTNTDFEGAPISQQVISHSRFDLCSCRVARRAMSQSLAALAPPTSLASLARNTDDAERKFFGV